MNAKFPHSEPLREAPWNAEFQDEAPRSTDQVLCDGEDQDASSAELDFVFQRFGKIGGIRSPVNQGVREQVINGPRGEGEAVGNERDDTS